MKAKFIEYLKSVGITAETLLQHIETLYCVATELAGNDFDSIFVDEYVDSDGVHHYEHLKLLSNEEVGVVVNDFLGEPRYGLAYSEPLSSIAISAKDYDFTSATEKSRLIIEGQLRSWPTVHCEYKASGMNCDNLRELLDEYLIPRLRRDQQRA